MARTVTEGLNGIAQADLAGLAARIQQLRAEAERALKLRAEALSRMSIDELLAALEAAKRRKT